MRLLGLGIFAAVIAILPLLFPENYYVTVVGVTMFFNVILAVGLNLFMGYAGQISLGHAAFFGLGAYSSAILTTKFGFNPWLAMGAGVALVWIVSYLVAKPILRLKGHYLAMATLGFGIIIHIFLVQYDTLTGGPDGLSSIPELSIFGWPINSDLRWYAVSATVMLLSILFSLNIVASRHGRALQAVHGSEVAAETMGIDTSRVKVHIFVISAVMAAVTGSLFVHEQAFISPDSCSFFFSIELVTMVVLGGMASTFGAVFGAAILTYLPEFLVVFQDFKVLIFGGILMFIMIFLPEGLFVGLCRLFTHFKQEQKECLTS